MIQVRHASASGRLDEGWTYDAATVRISLRLGSRLLDIVARVCSSERPVVGAHPIVRVGPESWRVLPSVYVREWHRGVERLEPFASTIGELAAGDCVYLTNTPLHVSAQIEQL